MPDVVVSVYDPFANDRNFNPLDEKKFRRLLIFTDNYEGTSPTLTYRLDGTPQPLVTGERLSNGEYYFYLGGVVGREMNDVVITLVDATDNAATVRYTLVEYEVRRRVRY